MKWNFRPKNIQEKGLNLRFISLQVIDVNDAPTNISLVSKGIYENATAGTVVGVLQAQDEDANQSHYFQLISSQGVFKLIMYPILN